MNKYKYILIGLCSLCAALVMAFIINILFKIKSDSIWSAEWSAGDALNYMGTIVGAISTFVLGVIAYKQNDKLQHMEDNNYIAANSCMVLIDDIQISHIANVPVDYESHTEQILKETNNKDDFPSGYSVEVHLKKIDNSIQAIPSLIYISKCTFLVGNNENNSLENALWLENVREGYTRVAVCESGIAFNCKILVPRNEQEKFEKDIKKEKNRLTIEMQFNVITDKYVMTKCKCRANCKYQNMCGEIAWKSIDPKVFFYGHELKNRKEILVLGE